MKKYFSLAIILIFVVAMLSDCAKRGRPEGGPKDEDAPIMVSSRPPFYTTNFDEDEIRIYFDEYIKLKDLQKQLIISPPLKYQPLIKPLGIPSKYISIKILDTLKENTTYTINFGQSVVDNTEGNILNNFKYVFSTGDIIDSLKVSGNITDAFAKDADENVTVMLYEVNDTFTDSVIYNEKPFYVGNSLDTTVWEITNMKAGKYLLLALSDAARNYSFDPKQDKIGFLKEHITVPSENDSSYSINLFKEELAFKHKRPSEVSKGHLLFGYEGVADSLKIIAINETDEFKSITNFEKDKDTLNLWYTGNSKDSIQFKIENLAYHDTVTVKLRSKIVDSLEIAGSSRGILHLRDRFKLLSSLPIESIDTSKINFIQSDSSKVPATFTISKSTKEVELDFTKKYNESYVLEFFPEAITDFFGSVNDTLIFNLSTKLPSDYGKLFLTLQYMKRYPAMVQLIKENGEIVEEKYAEKEQEYNFLDLVPAKYMIRIIFDDNKNRKWDTGNFLLKIQPEEVYYFETVLDVRANWEMTETFILD